MVGFKGFPISLQVISETKRSTSESQTPYEQLASWHLSMNVLSTCYNDIRRGDCKHRHGRRRSNIGVARSGSVFHSARNSSDESVMCRQRDDLLTASLPECRCTPHFTSIAARADSRGSESLNYRIHGPAPGSIVTGWEEIYHRPRAP